MMNPVILDGFKFMGLGMGMVFSFLIIMILLVKLNAIILAPFKNMFEPKSASSVKAPVAKKDLMANQELVKVIGAAIKAYQEKK
ncbi:MAG: OadG family protein [Lentisphaeria bacterium]